MQQTIRRAQTQRVLIVKPHLMSILKQLGATNISRCFDCGTCTVSCPFSEEMGSTPYPRTAIKYVKLGLEDKLVSSLEPWLCYYCGDCSNTCPKNAEPAEIMMALRRYLTTRYDFTGISRIMYFGRWRWLLAIIVVASLPLLLAWLLKGPVVTERVELATFAPYILVEIAGLTVFIVLATLLLINIYRMYKFTVGSLSGISLSRALIEFLKIVPLHFFTQLRLSKCSFKRYWYIHLLIFIGYGFSFILFVPLLRFTLTNEPFLFVHPLSTLGILSTIFLLIGGTYVLIGRLLKTQPIWKYSHHTDMMFVILLILVTLTGILTGIFRTLGYPILTYALFTIHLSLAAPFLILEVPFAKWAHLAYRPFALYFHRLRMLKEGLMT
jgi:Heterodisulfide reductase, subunit C